MCTVGLLKAANTKNSIKQQKSREHQCLSWTVAVVFLPAHFPCSAQFSFVVEESRCTCFHAVDVPNKNCSTIVLDRKRDRVNVSIKIESIIQLFVARSSKGLPPSRRKTKALLQGNSERKTDKLCFEFSLKTILTLVRTSVLSSNVKRSIVYMPVQTVNTHQQIT